MHKVIFSLPGLLLLFYSCNTSSETSKSTSDSLVGSWNLVADQELDHNNLVIKEDTSVAGLLIYTDDGRMSVQLLWQGTRTKIINDSIMNFDGISTGIGLGANTWSTEQARTIIDAYDAYFGKYSVDWHNNIVTHTIDGNLRPENQGTAKKRTFELNGDTLLLRSTDTAMKWQVKWVKN